MKKTILIFFLSLAFYNLPAQYIYKIKADSILITNDSCTAELNLENRTKDTLGFLYNKGKGRTEFRRALIRRNDSIYLIGADTLNIAKVLRANGGGTVALPISALLAAVNSNTINNGNYTQEWKWDSLSSGVGLRLTANTTAAASNTQKLFEVYLSGANATTSQSTYAGYFTNVHSSGSELYTTNYGIYSRATGDIFANIGGYFEAGGSYSEGNNTGIHAYANNQSANRVNNVAGYFRNNGGDRILGLHQEDNTAITGISFTGNSTDWGMGKRANGNFEFNNSLYFSGDPVLQLYPANRVRIGGATDDGANTLQVNGTLWTASDASIYTVTIGRGGSSKPTNTALGYNALAANSTGDYNLGVGYKALEANTSGAANTSIGYQSLYLNTSGSSNTALGGSSLQKNTTGNSNTAVGSSLYNNTTGSDNSTVGYFALAGNVTGSYNVAIGSQALNAHTSGSFNSVFGYSALSGLTSGNNNIAIGDYAGNLLTTGGTNILIGSNVQATSTTSSNQLNIGNWIYGNAGSIGIGVNAPTAKLHLLAGTSSASSAPLKFNAGTNMSTPENGAVEYDGTDYFVSSGSTRYTLARTLAATSTLNFPSTAAQSSADLTVSISGAADGDAVSIGVPAAAMNTNSTYSAWVSATGTVTIRFNNYSSSSIDPASAAFKIRVIK